MNRTAKTYFATDAAGQKWLVVESHHFREVVLAAAGEGVGLADSIDDGFMSGGMVYLRDDSAPATSWLSAQDLVVAVTGTVDGDIDPDNQNRAVAPIAIARHLAFNVENELLVLDIGLLTGGGPKPRVHFHPSFRMNGFNREDCYLAGVDEIVGWEEPGFDEIDSAPMSDATGFIVCDSAGANVFVPAVGAAMLIGLEPSSALESAIQHERAKVLTAPRSAPQQSSEPTSGGPDV